MKNLSCIGCALFVLTLFFIESSNSKHIGKFRNAVLKLVASGSLDPLPNYTFYWNITEQSMLEVEIHLQASAWVGFGIRAADSKQAMANADIYTAIFYDPDNYTVYDRWSLHSGLPG